MKIAYTKSEINQFLLSKGYSQEQVNFIFLKINYFDASSLLNIEYLNDICHYLKYDFFDINNLPRYIQYKQIKNYDYETTITHVNIGIDKEFYTDVKKVIDPRNYSVCINKYNKLDNLEYEPTDLVFLNENYGTDNIKLREIVCEKYKQLYNDLKEENIILNAISGFIPYNKYPKKNEKQGHLEEQAGFSINLSINNLSTDEIIKTEIYKTFLSKLHQYGFILRYPENKEHITGYKFDPTHIRYVDKISKEIYDRNITLEEYLSTLPIKKTNSYQESKKFAQIDYLTLINEENQLSKDFIPKNMIRIQNNISEKIDKGRIIMLVEQVSDNFIKMKNTAYAEKKYEIDILSGYRSFEYQQQLSETLRFKFGEEYVSKFCAKPGTSEHQSGLAFDIAIIKDGDVVNFKTVPEIQNWIHSNAHKFGFILRYPENKKHITGYDYEPWHFRYVGIIEATYIYENNLTLEEYLNFKKTSKLLKMEKGD